MAELIVPDTGHLVDNMTKDIFPAIESWIETSIQDGLREGNGSKTELIAFSIVYCCRYSSKQSAIDAVRPVMNHFEDIYRYIIASKELRFKVSRPYKSKTATDFCLDLLYHLIGEFQRLQVESGKHKSFYIFSIKWFQIIYKLFHISTPCFIFHRIGVYCQTEHEYTRVAFLYRRRAHQAEIFAR
jgi:hypothetical protein